MREKPKTEQEKKNRYKKFAVVSFVVIAVAGFLAYLGSSVIGSMTQTFDDTAMLLDSLPEKTQEAVKSEENKTEQSTEKSESDAQLHNVIRVVDGDTAVLRINGKNERVRLIGIDTPETVDPQQPVECFGQEASEKAKELLAGKKVMLETDASQGERDKYGRLLGYFIFPDGRNFNKIMIEQGYAYEYTYDEAYKYQDNFKQAEKEAQQGGRGLWASGVCDGEQVQNESRQSSPQENDIWTIFQKIRDALKEVESVIGLV